MAKKAEKPKPAPKTTLAAAKDAVVTVAGTVTDAVTHAAEATNAHVVKPVTDALGITTPKKARAVRAKAEKKPKPAPVATAPRSTKPAGKMMTKGLAAAPKEGAKAGPKAKSRTKP